MVLASVTIPENKINEFEKLDIKDSKKHSKNRREELFNIIVNNYIVKYEILEANIIDKLMETTNLNKIELMAFGKLINSNLKEIWPNFKEIKVNNNSNNNNNSNSNKNNNNSNKNTTVEIYIDACSSNEIAFGNQLKNILIVNNNNNSNSNKNNNNSNKNTTVEIYIDACSSNEIAFGNQLKNILIVNNSNIKIISEHKADDNYKIVSAASIVAKVIRDRKIEEYKKIYGNIGSGYPSDKITQKYLKEYIIKYNKPPIIARKSWSTTKKLMKYINDKNNGKNINNSKIIKKNIDLKKNRFNTINTDNKNNKTVQTKLVEI